MTTHLCRDIGHPWTAEPGWDQMLLTPDDDQAETLHKMVAKAKERFWRTWWISDETLLAYMYKPSGATREWQDVKWQGTPRGHGQRFKVGDEVWTDFSGEITKHHIVEIVRSDLTLCGVSVRVKPPVPGSEFIGDNDQVYGRVLIDASWFRKVEE